MAQITPSAQPVQRKVIVSERDNIAALFEDSRAIEFFINRGDMLLGDIHLVSVENILPSIDAAFVNMGSDKMGFLHASDVQGKGELKSRLKPKQNLLVQIIKEPTGHKGPRVTTDISLPGRFLVLIPDSKGISISRKIEKPAERSRLKSIVSMLKPSGMGVIIRTEASEQKESDIQEDLETLLERWQNIVAIADTTTPPSLLYRDQDLLYRVVREVVNEDVHEIVLDSAFGQQRAQQLLQTWNMDKNIKVTLYSGSQPFLIGTGVDKEIKLALQTRVPLPSGGYLYIQPTEALCVVDVNSGKFTSLESQAETIRLTNLEATKEIARQLRLRNIGGMIVVDFIDMESRAHQLALLEAFENELAPDKSKPQMGQLTDLGLVEMTRHRQGQSLSEIFTKRCTSCNGTGHSIEEFNWTPLVDREARQVQRFQRGGQQQNNQQGQQYGNQQGNRGYQQGNRFPQQGNQQNQQGGYQQRRGQQNQQNQTHQPVVPTLNRLVAPRTTAAPDQTALPSFAQANAAKNRPQPAQNDRRTATGGVSPDRPVDELFKDKMVENFGMRSASIVKMSHTPYEANSVLSRINPKSNDIQTLVHAIEGGTPMIMEDPILGQEDGSEEDTDTLNEALNEGLSEGLDLDTHSSSPADNGSFAVQDTSELETVAVGSVGPVFSPAFDNEEDTERETRGGRPGLKRVSEGTTPSSAKRYGVEDSDFMEDADVEVEEETSEASPPSPRPGGALPMMSAVSSLAGAAAQLLSSATGEGRSAGGDKPKKRRGRPPKKTPPTGAV